MDRRFCGLNFPLRMGKRRRLDRFISKWIKSDLPEDRSTVLLLGVTRIPTSPVPARRPCSLPLVIPDDPRRSTAQTRRSSFSSRRQALPRRSSSSCSRRRPDRTAAVDVPPKWSAGEVPRPADDSAATPSNRPARNETSAAGPVMDRSVDSIGTCSLDVEASADLSDWSEASSVGTLRSASPKTPSTEPHLPSYLSLACTVNGYSTTTNYDPERLARSRDASPHRPQNDNLTPRNVPTYSIQNNLLSPPNLVPLPTRAKPKMADNALAQHHHHQEFYRSTKTMTFLSKESHFSTSLFDKDTVDACYENGHAKKHNVSFESQHFSSTITSAAATNGQAKSSTESSSFKTFSNGAETKSFIQQRVERLYGPGALAQGFFVMKRQKNRESESENDTSAEDKDDKPVDKLAAESQMKQSTSSPTLPVLRHLRPEFRAQLPIISPRKGAEGAMQKSSTVPTLAEEVKVNGHSKHVTASEGGSIAKSVVAEATGEKNGHHFLKILQAETERLLKLADKAEAELADNEGLSEEVVGKIRSASGKARLLASQKMQQFKGLCTNNITQVEGEAFPTTNEDLQGFWDMVMLQVDQVEALFKELDVLKANSWQEVKTEDEVRPSMNGKPKKLVARAASRPTSAANEEARKQREAQRKRMIEERRKAMKAQAKPVESIEIFVPESS